VEMAQQVWRYFQQRAIAVLMIGYIAGLAAVFTVEGGKRRSWWFHLLVGALGSFVGQYAVFYMGLREILESLPEFRYIFDFFIAYLGSFVVAAVVHFIKPL
jgi:uncharacterized membrane protein YeaQ/YmgE (transglycosylase-associated protein family)